MADDLDLFGSWAELTDALKPKSLKGRKKIWWHVDKQVVSLKRNRRRREKSKRAEKAFIKRAVDGPRDRARPTALAALERANHAQRTGEPGDWMELLRGMGDLREWRGMELAARCGLCEATTGRYLHVMLAKGFVSRTGKAYGTRWRRTELGASVAAGLVEWRTVRVYKRWKYRNLRLAKARAGLDGSGAVPVAKKPRGRPRGS